MIGICILYTYVYFHYLTEYNYRGEKQKHLSRKQKWGETIPIRRAQKNTVIKKGLSCLGASLIKFDLTLFHRPELSGLKESILNDTCACCDQPHHTYYIEHDIVNHLDTTRRGTIFCFVFA